MPPELSPTRSTTARKVPRLTYTSSPHAVQRAANVHPQLVDSAHGISKDPYPLGKHIKLASSLFVTHGWEYTVRALRTPQDMPSDVAAIPHPAGGLLNHLRRHGAPIKMKTAPWSREMRDEAIGRGPHKSAHEHHDFLGDEMATMVHRGQWMVLPYDLVKNIPNLRISPLGVVPQHDRRPRTIVDYSFYGINDDTIPLAPHESMQFGRALDRVLHEIVHADPRHGPVHMIKVDVADGFYRLWAAPQDIPTLGVAFPPGPDGAALVAFPLTLPMGWLESPPLFCTMTETITDLANATELPFPVDQPHRLEPIADTQPAEEPSHVSPRPDSGPVVAVPVPAHPLGPRRPPLRYYDVYMDDFLGLFQGGPRRLQQCRRRLFHCIDRVLRPLSADDPDTRQEPSSLKKLGKGDACLTTRKVMLGWLIDTVAETISLPPRRLQRLHDMLDSLPRSKRRIATNEWQKILGELRSMARAIPGLRGLFSLMQEALRHDTRARIPLSAELHDFLDDLRTLVASLEERPTRLREIVPTDPFLVGACDAAGVGMGGVAFLPRLNGPPQPILWRAPFPADVQQSLVSFDNPAGTISNSDLELAGTIAHHDVLVHALDVREKTIYTLTDNTPAAAWQSKGSTTTTGPAAYLLRLQALHQRQYRYAVRVSHIPGPANSMADDCSRLWHLTDSDLLAHFALHYPQETPWQVLPLRPPMLSALISALHKKRPALPSLPPASAPLTVLGQSGNVSVCLSTSTPPSAMSTLPLRSSKSTPCASAVESSPKARDLSALVPFLRPSVKWARRSPWWGPRTLV